MARVRRSLHSPRARFECRTLFSNSNLLSVVHPVLRVYDWEKQQMIRIEGIPVVARRLADAEKVKSIQSRNKTRKTSKIAAAGQALLAIHSALRTKKVA